MDRTAPARELKPRFEIATPADDEAIRGLLRRNPMRGSVSLSLEREPDYFRGANIAGGRDQTIVVKSGAKVICMGRCIRRECWLNGRPQDVGYLAELRLDESAQGRFGILRDGFRFFYENERDYPADFYFTSIAADNERARRLLESGARGLPEYRFLGEVETLLVAVPRRPAEPKLRIEKMTDGLVPQVVELLTEQGRRNSLGAVWTADSIRQAASHGLPQDQCYVVREGSNVLAFGGLWDQRQFRQTVIRGYSRSLAIARPFVNFASRVFRTASIPKVGAILPHVFLSPLTIGVALPAFIKALMPHAAEMGAQYLTLSLPRESSCVDDVRRAFTTRTWRSRLYRVSWPDQESVEASGPFLPDVALL